MDEERTQRISEWIAGELREFACVRRAVLFGSRARGDNGERSDIDLAIETVDATEQEWSAILDAIEDAPTLLKIDVLDVSRVTDRMRSEIDRDGVEIYAFRPRAA